MIEHILLAYVLIGLVIFIYAACCISSGGMIEGWSDFIAALLLCAVVSIFWPLYLLLCGWPLSLK